MKIVLPYPHKDLSPNSHKHWRYKAHAASEAKETARILTLAALQREQASKPDAKMQLTIVFNPPDRRKRDDDNAIAAFKHYRDGIAKAMGIDDNNFITTFSMGEVVKGGQTQVEIRYATPQAELEGAQP